MTRLRYTLVAEGSSDAALLPALDWLLAACGTSLPVTGARPDLGRLLRRPRGLRERIAAACQLHPCELLFVHRDADTAGSEARRREIDLALGSAGDVPAAVCVVPVRMTEAWLLFDEPAIRRAAGNPCGTAPLNLPPLTSAETIPDPKEVLAAALAAASGLGARRRRLLRPAPARVADYIDDFSPLRALSAFQALEQDLTATLSAHGWRVD